MQLGQPTLREPLIGSDRVNLRDDGYGPSNDCCLGLRSRHSTQSRCHEKYPSHVRVIRQVEILPCRIQDGYRGTMHNPLRSDVHVRPGSHLSVLRNAQSAHVLVIGLGGIVGNDQPIGYDCHRGIFGGWKQS